MGTVSPICQKVYIYIAAGGGREAERRSATFVYSPMPERCRTHETASRRYSTRISGRVVPPEALVARTR